MNYSKLKLQRYFNRAIFFLIIFLNFLILSVSCKKSLIYIPISCDTITHGDLSKPNIIFILGDDIGYEIPTYTGGQSYSTPTLDMLAANGTQFSKCQAIPLCSPSRFMLLTGKYNFRNYTAWGKMNATEKTIATLLRDNGYATCVSGKWQLGGGNDAIHSLGFENYLVSNPDSNLSSEDSKEYYKTPEVYENGSFWSEDQVKGKYGPDIFRDYIFNFIDCYKNKKPFFIYWSFNLCHRPWSPTPDDANFAVWQPGPNRNEDSIYFPSMIKYMDKQIGQLITKLNAENPINKTIIFFTGDNGTDYMTSKWNGESITGKKGLTIEYGTHVPMIAYSPGFVKLGVTDTSLIDFTDFFPTICNLVSIVIPQSYETIDGVDFAPRLTGNTGKPRSWIFCHYNAHPEDGSLPVRWMQNYSYKKYDTSFMNKGNFFDLRDDPLEKKIIYPLKMDSMEKKINSEFLINMSTLN